MNQPRFSNQAQPKTLAQTTQPNNLQVIDQKHAEVQNSAANKLSENILMLIPMIVKNILQLYGEIPQELTINNHSQNITRVVTSESQAVISLAKIYITTVFNKLLARGKEEILQQFSKYINCYSLLVDQIIKQLANNRINITQLQNNNSNINVRQCIKEIVNTKISQICMKILQIIHWLKAYEQLIVPKTSQQNKRQSLHEIATILIDFSSKMDKKSKLLQQQNYYFTKLVGIKKYQKWNNQFIAAWFVKKKQISSIFKHHYVHAIYHVIVASLDAREKYNKNGVIMDIKSGNVGICEQLSNNKEKYMECAKNQQSIAFTKNKSNINVSNQHNKDKIIVDEPYQKQKKEDKPPIQKNQISNKDQCQKFEQQKKHQTEKSLPKLPNLRTREQQSQFRQRVQKCNIFNYIKKYFIITNQNYNIMVQISKQLYNAQHIFIKMIINSIVQLSKINNSRFNSNVIGDQFKYYCVDNTISNRLFKNHGWNGNGGEQLSFNKEGGKEIRKKNFYKLTYPSKLQQYFTLKHGQQTEQQKILHTLAPPSQSPNYSPLKRYPPQISKYLCEQCTKQQTQLFINSQDIILTNRLKITTQLINHVIVERFPWIFAAEQGLYKF